VSIVFSCCCNSSSRLHWCSHLFLEPLWDQIQCTPKEWELDPKATLLDLATGTLLSALLGPLLDGQGDILGSLGTPQQQRSSATDKCEG